MCWQHIQQLHSRLDDEIRVAYRCVKLMLFVDSEVVFSVVTSVHKNWIDRTTTVPARVSWRVPNDEYPTESSWCGLQGVDACVNASSRHMMTRSVRNINVKFSGPGTLISGCRVFWMACDACAASTRLVTSLQALQRLCREL